VGHGKPADADRRVSHQNEPVALLQCAFFSEVLGLSTSMSVILPQETSTQIGLVGQARDGVHPTLYLLHGLSDDDTTWLRRTSIERYVSALGLAVVMPRVDRSFYSDERHGNRYWTFLSEELPIVVEGFFHVSPRREDTFVAGLSMGGYGALKWALRQPQRFAAAASLSGALNIAERDQFGGRPGLKEQIFGGQSIRATPDDLIWLLDQVDPPSSPSMYVCCGAEDDLLGENRTFIEAAERRGFPVTVDIGPGRHEWGYWDRKVQDVLAWLPIG